MTRTATVWICAAALAGSSLLPPAHIHLAADDHDAHHHHHHHPAVEHAHFAPHAVQGGAIDHGSGEGAAIYVDHPARSQGAAAGLSAPPAILVALLPVTPPATHVGTAQRDAGNAPRDGPSLDRSNLRGPPSVL